VWKGGRTYAPARSSPLPRAGSNACFVAALLHEGARPLTPTLPVEVTDGEVGVSVHMLFLGHWISGIFQYPCSSLQKKQDAKVRDEVRKEERISARHQT
jgi:hypothetical protein